MNTTIIFIFLTSSMISLSCNAMMQSIPKQEEWEEETEVMHAARVGDVETLLSLLKNSQSKLIRNFLAKLRL